MQQSNIFNCWLWQQQRVATPLQRSAWRWKSDRPAGPEASVKPDLPQVDLDDDVGDGVEHKLDVLGVRGAGHVTIDLEKNMYSLQ